MRISDWSSDVCSSDLDALPDTQAAILRVNPATAAHLLDRLALSPGDWLIQNAATSSVAGWVRRLAAGRGIHILNVVRAAQRGDGPDIFLTDGDDLADRVKIGRAHV